MIPPFIFQVTPTGKPSKQERAIITKHLPYGWNMTTFHESGMIDYLKKFPQSIFPQILQVYHSFRHFAHRIDLFRYFMLYTHGGFFLDADVVLSPTPVSLEKVAKTNDLVCVSAASDKQGLYTGMMGAAPQHPVIGQMLQHIMNTSPAILVHDPYHFHKKIQTFVAQAESCTLLEYVITTDEKEQLLHIIDENKQILFEKSVGPVQSYSQILKKEPVTLEDQTLIQQNPQLVKEPDTSIGQTTNEPNMKRIFTEIYKKKKGPDVGSTLSFNEATYIPFLKSFFLEKKIQSVVDIGCGNFTCGPATYDTPSTNHIEYDGYDIYSPLIEYLQETYKDTPRYHFHCTDVTESLDTLKKADLCILKDVLQHWNLTTIYQTLDALIRSKKYKYILICNCITNAKHNEEIVTGGWRGLRASMYPLLRYQPKVVYMYQTKEVSLITVPQ